MEMVWIHIISIGEGRFTPTPWERVDSYHLHWRGVWGRNSGHRGAAARRRIGDGHILSPLDSSHVSPCPRSDELYTDIRRQQCAHMDQCSHDEHGELFVARGIDDFYDDPCGQQLPAEHPSVRGVSGQHSYDQHARCGRYVRGVSDGYPWCGLCVVDPGACGSVGAGPEPAAFYD